MNYSIDLGYRNLRYGKIIMGTLRLLLALSVVHAHFSLIESPFFIQAGLAVIFFYMISGFYMTMIITEKYKLLGDGW